MASPQSAMEAGRSSADSMVNLDVQMTHLAYIPQSRPEDLGAVQDAGDLVLSCRAYNGRKGGTERDCLVKAHSKSVHAKRLQETNTGTKASSKKSDLRMSILDKYWKGGSKRRRRVAATCIFLLRRPAQRVETPKGTVSI